MGGNTVIIFDYTEKKNEEVKIVKRRKGKQKREEEEEEESTATATVRSSRVVLGLQPRRNEEPATRQGGNTAKLRQSPSDAVSSCIGKKSQE